MTVKSICFGVETMPCLITSPGLEEMPAIDASIAGQSSGIMGVSAADSSSGIEDVSIAGPSRVGETSTIGSSTSFERASVPGSIVEGISAYVKGATVADPDPYSKTSQDILGKFVEDWLETLDKEEMKSVSLFLCYQLVPYSETMAAEYAASMPKKSERTVRRWRSGLIDNDGVLLESQQGCYQ